MVKVNAWVNESIKPMTDLEHWGVVERWNYPDDGYGDCEDYVLLKRRMLMQAGWPREALLITVVRDQKGDGHAVLTVKTDQRRIRSRQPGAAGPALDQDRLPLREAPVAIRSERVGLARRAAPAPPPPFRRADAKTKELAPRSRPHPSPSPDRFASGRISPRSGRNIFR